MNTKHNKTPNSVDPISIAQRLLNIESEALKNLSARLDNEFCHAVDLLINCNGKIIVTGLGKSGIAARKIAATLASSGSPALFLHAAEAVHGDMGVISKGDIAITISYSGETREVIDLLPRFKLLDVPVIALSGKPDSTLASLADVHIDVSVPPYEWPFGLIPTASHTTTVAIGDALAITLLLARKVKEEDFALLHPGGLLGRKMLVKVADLMHTGKSLPVVHPNDGMRNVLTEITSKMMGVTCVIDTNGRLIGIITDGDIRRLLERNPNPLDMSADKAMTRNPKCITGDIVAARAIYIMERHSITSLPVINDNKELIGLIHMHDVIKLETSH